MKLAARESTRLRGIDQPFAVELIDERIERVALKGVKIEDSTHFPCAFAVRFHDAPPFPTDVSVAVGSLANKEAGLNATKKTIANVQRLLLCVERCHVGKRSPHHPSRWRVLCRLSDVDDFQIEVDFQSLQLDIVEEVARCSIHFEEQYAGKVGGVILSVAQELTEGSTLVGLRSSLSDAEELDDFPVILTGVSVERLFLDF